MLVLSRKVGERILIGDDIEVVVTQIKGKVTLGVTAPKDVRILRAELKDIPPTPRQKQQAQPRPRKPFIGRRPSAA